MGTGSSRIKSSANGTSRLRGKQTGGIRKLSKSRSHLSYLAVDLGTTRSAIAYALPGPKGRPEARAVVRDSLPPKIATAVFFPDNGTPIIGDEALEAGENDGKRLYTDFKLDLPYDRYLKPLPDETPVSSRQVAKLVISKLLQNAEKSGIDVSQPVFCHPVGEDWAQAILKLAAEMNIEAVAVSEPFAALYWAHEKYQIFDERNETVLLIDFGGGTCDFLLMKVEGIWNWHFRPQPVVVDEDRLHFGGRNIDLLVKAELIRQWKASTPTRRRPQLPELDDVQLQREARRVKEKLSRQLSEGIQRPESIKIPGLPSIEVTSEQLRKLTAGEIRRRFEWLLMKDDQERGHYKLLGRKKITENDLTRVILTGGSSRLPWVQDIVSELFPHLGRAARIRVLEPPDLSVAYGAALYAYDIDNSTPRLRPFLEETLSIELANGQVYQVVKRGTQLPVKEGDFAGTHFFSFPETGTKLTLNVVKGEGHRAAECQRLSSDAKILQFTAPIEAGTRMKMNVAVDTKGDVAVKVSRAGLQPGEMVKVFFSRLEVTMQQNK